MGHRPRREETAGLNLEYAVAVVLLKLGIPFVRCGVELTPRKGTRTEGELDLVFNWGSKLWIVDCKDRASDAQKVDNLRTAFLKNGPVSSSVQRQLDLLRKLLEERQIKVLREDLQQANDPAQIENPETILFAVVGFSPAILTETVWALAQEQPSIIPDGVIVATIAGGRKTMSALLYAGMSLVGHETDRVTHVLVDEKSALDRAVSRRHPRTSP